MPKAYTASAIATERDSQGNIRDITYTGKNCFFSGCTINNFHGRYFTFILFISPYYLFYALRESEKLADIERLRHNLKPHCKGRKGKDALRFC